MRVMLDMIPATEIRVGDTLLDADCETLGTVTAVEVTNGRGAVSHKMMARVTYTTTVELYEGEHVTLLRDTY